MGAPLYNAQHLHAELGRLHMENLALRVENEDLRSALAASAPAGPAATLDPQGEAATVDPGASGDDQDGQPGGAE